MTEDVMTKKILECFEEISKIPRQSKHEEKICAWLQDWAKKNDFGVKTDAVNNIVIQVPGSPGYENSPTLVLQGHVDMVCEKTPDSNHDFSKDPIKFVYDGDWLTADKTTLGADNGIAIAMALVLAQEKDMEHPPLELLFTVDEETGLTGARSLEPGFIEGKILLNLDSEDEGYFTVGCAGGKDTTSTFPLEFSAISENMLAYELNVGGHTGGHSGVDINCHRANAILSLARVLQKLANLADIQLASIQGGSAHNAIPRDAYAILLVKEADVEKLTSAVSEIEKVLKQEYKNTDPDLAIKFSPSSKELGKKAVSREQIQKIAQFIQAIPHGINSMSTDMKGLVETSNNLATVTITNGKLEILTSQRSSVMSRLDALTQRIEGIANISGGEAKSGGGYPSWQPNMESPLLARCLKVYRETLNKEPVVDVIHAGLECGIIGSKYEGMDMISFGPTIKNPHCPDEKIKIDTIGQIWQFLIALLKSFK